MAEKRPKKRSGGKARRVKHLPWDEVSLPGAGTSPTEQPTILQVLNNKQLQQAATTKAAAKEAATEATAAATETAETVTTDWAAAADAAVADATAAAAEVVATVTEAATSTAAAALTQQQQDDSNNTAEASFNPDTVAYNETVAAAPNVVNAAAVEQAATATVASVLEAAKAHCATLDNAVKAAKAEATARSETLAAATDEATTSAGSEAETETVEAAVDKRRAPLPAQSSDDLVSSHSTSDSTDNSLSNISVASQIPATTAAAPPPVATTTVTAPQSEGAGEAAATGTPHTIASPPGVDRQCSKSSSSSQEHILDIEPHLIETYDEYQAPDDSVGINELPPQQDELTHGSSKIETDANVRTVIEVEPAGAKSKKPIEIVVQQRQEQAQAHIAKGADTQTKAEEDVKENISNANTHAKVDADVEAVPETEPTLKVVTVDEQQSESETDTISPEVSDEIKQTAAKLVDEIELEVLEILRKCEEAKEEIKAEAVSEAVTETEPKATAQTPAEVSDIEAEKQPEHKTEPASTSLLEEINSTLSQKVDAQLSEVTSILKSSSKHGHVTLQLSGADGEELQVDIDQTPSKELKIVKVPSLDTPFEEEERKRFLESLPQIESKSEAQRLADDCKREYYQSLKKYLIDSEADKPPIPLQTYRWEDLRRAKERGGYPWTHLYKRPLGPDEEPEIVLLLRKSQEFRFTSESPKSLKKVRIDEQVLIKEAERYIQDLSDTEEDQPQSAPEDEETHSLRSESISCVSDSVLATGKPRKSTRLDKIRNYLRRRHGGRAREDTQSLPCTSTDTSRHHSEENLAPETQIPIVNGRNSDHKSEHCYPIMKKLKSMADRQKKRLNIRRIHLGKDEKIVLGEETKILKLKKSPKSERGEIPHFIEKQDSDDVLEIMELDESPSRKRRDDGRYPDEDANNEVVMHEEEKETIPVSIVVPDEIIEIQNVPEKVEDKVEAETEVEAATIAVKVEEDVCIKAESAPISAPPPKKAPRLRREHVYEEIEQDLPPTEPATNGIMPVGGIFELTAVEALKDSLAKQHNSTLKDIEAGVKPLPLDRMGSSEEEQIAAAVSAAAGDRPAINLIAPLSSIDSTSSDEERNRTQLSPVAEESDAASIEDNLRIVEDAEPPADLKPAIKKETSPAPSDKKVTFSHVEDEAEPHREDIELSAEVQEATQEAAQRKKWNNMSDHEYEPIASPPNEGILFAKEPSPAPLQHSPQPQEKTKLAKQIAQMHDDMQETEDFQRDIEDRYFGSAATTPRAESRTDYEVHTSQVDSSALEEPPLKPENRKKGLLASAQDRTRKMQAGIKNQAGKIKTKLRTPAKKSPSGSPKAKERRKFKAPEFSKIKMPEIKRPDMSKLKEFKRPEFTKFNKPDMSKFKLPEKFPTFKLKRSKSLKENEATLDDEMSGVSPDNGVTTDSQPQPQPQPQPHKKLFEFNFGTYPRAFRKKKKPLEPQISLGTETGTEGLSVIPSTGTQPSVESSSSPQGDRGPGPVRSRWADKFSDVSYNDSEGSRYRRYGSEQESFDRESSLERRMKDDLEETTESEAQDLGIIGGVADTKQFAEFDEENRAIHEISKKRAGEFKRRPIVHQDSDLRSEDSKEAEGWTDKEIEKNKLLRKAELEAEASYLKFPAEEESSTQETQSRASSGKEVVMEEIDDDEFILRKRGVSEDNIELREYISNAIREEYDRPINALKHVGESTERIEYGEYDIPPPKPQRLHKTYRPQDMSQDRESQRSEYGDDLSMSQNGSDFFSAPKRPMRKGRSRSKYSMDSQDVPTADESLRHEQYFDDDEEYLRPPRSSYKDDVSDGELNDLNFSGKHTLPAEPEKVSESIPPPQPPSRRRKRDLRDTSMDTDSYMNGFGGRSVSSSYLQPPEDVIVYRTEHEYPIPLATPEHYTPSTDSRKLGAVGKFDDDDRTSRGADSLGMDDINKTHMSEDEAEADDVHEKFIIDMMENDGYAVVRKEHMPKPTPPARRKKFTRSPGERFATIPNGTRTKRSTPPPERPPPPREYIRSVDPEELVEEEELEQPLQPVPPRRKSATSVEINAAQNYEDDYEEPEALQQDRPESPRDLQSGEVINKMKYRPLPPPPRPPREKRQRAESKSSSHSAFQPLREHELTDDRIATSSTADSYEPTDADLDEEELRLPEVEVSTQTDPLPDDFECEEFEITEDMRVIEPRTQATKKTLDELLREEQQKVAAASADVQTPQLTEDEQLALGLQRFRDANQRSMSERSRASSTADRSKSQSRPQTPSAVVIERRVSTPIPSQHSETMLEASLIVRPIDDLDLEEEELRREGLLTDSSYHSKSDVEGSQQSEEAESRLGISDYSQGPSSEELNIALDELRSPGESAYEEESEKENVAIHEPDYEEEQAIEDEAEAEPEPQSPVARTMRDFGYDGETEESKHTSYDRYDDEEMMAIEEELQKLKSAETESAKKATTLSEDEHYTEQSDVEDKLIAVEKEETVEEPSALDDELQFEEPPLPPPRRKSTTTIESPTSTQPTLTLVEQSSKELTPVQSLTHAEQPTDSQLPAHMADLEVERLRVHALQAGQIMVSQLHGSQISADDLECKTGNLVVKSIELPEGFIEDIVERVRSTERHQLLTCETQTSRQPSSEALSHEDVSPVRETVPPPKPPRQRDLEAISRQRPADASQTSADEYASERILQQLRNFDEQTQTDPTTFPPMGAVPPPPVYATTEYLQSLPPLAFYNLRRPDEHYGSSVGGGGVAVGEAADESALQRRARHHHHHHHHRHHRHHKCESSSSELGDSLDEGDGDESRSREPSRGRRSRSSTRPPSEPQTVAKAGKQLLSACSLSLAQIINRITTLMRGGDEDKETEVRLRHIPTLVLLFIAITFVLLVYLLSGRNVHTHHWDFFNLPGNEGRPS